MGFLLILGLIFSPEDSNHHVVPLHSVVRIKRVWRGVESAWEANSKLGPRPLTLYHPNRDCGIDEHAGESLTTRSRLKAPAKAMSVDWGETKAILLEVESLFNRDDDIRDVQDIKKMAHEIEVHCANNLKDAKEIIKRE